MPFTIPEAIADFPALLALVQKIVAEAEKLPKPPAEVSVKAFGDLAAAVLPDLGALVDQVRKQAAD